jgi:hypothetical protein
MYGTELNRASAVFSTATHSVPTAQARTAALCNYIGYVPRYLRSN